MVTDPQVQCVIMCDYPLNQMLFQRFSINAGPAHMIRYNKSMVMRFWSASPGLCQIYLQEVVFGNSLNDCETRPIRCHVKNMCRFYIHLALTYYLVGPSYVVV
jgi:hypothetical protein